MNYTLFLTAIIFLFLASTIISTNTYPKYKALEKFWDWSINNFPGRQWRWPWHGRFHVPWYSAQHSYWQHPYQPWRPLPATGVVSNLPGGRCDDYCPGNVCDEYRDRRRKLRDCLNCTGRGLCIKDTNSGECGKCDQADKSLGSCYDQYGCRDVNFDRGNFQLLNPKDTGCRLCPN
jgi:hypothetical protein